VKHTAPSTVKQTPLGLRRTKPRTVIICACTRRTDRPRNGECPPCALRTSRGHKLGPACEICGLADRRMLRRHTLSDRNATLCANHSALAGRRSVTLAELHREASVPATAA